MQNRRGKDATRKYFCIFLLISSDKPCVGQPTQTHFTHTCYIKPVQMRKQKHSSQPIIVAAVHCQSNLQLLSVKDTPKVQYVYTICIALYRSIYIHTMQIAIKRRPVENAFHIIIFHVLCCLFNYCFLLIIYFLIYLRAFYFFGSDKESYCDCLFNMA